MLTKDEFQQLARDAGFAYADGDAVDRLVAALAARAAKQVNDAVAIDRIAIMVQAVTDPENQPSQFGTVTVEFMEAATAEARALVEQMLKALETCRWYSDDDGQIEQGFLDIPVDQAKAAARAWLGEAQKGDGHHG